MNKDIVPVTLPVQGTETLGVNCRCTDHVESESMVPEKAKTEEQVKAALYAPVMIPAEVTDSHEYVRVISISEKGGPSRPVVVTCGEKQVLTMLEASAPNCTGTHLNTLASFGRTKVAPCADVGPAEGGVV